MNAPSPRPTPDAGGPAVGRRPSRSADVAGFVAGGLAAALGIAIAELLAGLVAGAPSLVIAIGDLVIENQPPGAKELMVELFGTNNKLALNAAIIVAAIVVAGLLGVAGRRRWGIAVAGFLVAGAVGLVAALAQSLTDPFLAVLTVAVAIAAALGVAARHAAVPPAPPGRVRSPPVVPTAAAAWPPGRRPTGTDDASCR